MGRTVVYRLRAELRRRPVAFASQIALVALLGGMVLAALAGAERTATAYDRLLDEVDPPELLVSPPGVPGADPTPFYEAIGDLPGVRGVRAIAGMPVLPLAGTPDDRLIGPQAGIGVLARLGAEDPRDAAVGRPRMLRGRLPDPRRAEEIFVSQRFSAAAGLDVGDRLPVVLVTSAQTETLQHAEPEDGQPIDFVITGVGVLYDEVIPFSDLNAQGSAIATPALAALLDRYDWNFEGAMVDVDPSQDLDRTTARIEELSLRPELGTGGPVFVSDQRASARQVSDALQPLGVGLRVAGFAIALVAIVVVGQAVSRSTREDQTSANAQRAIGLRPADRVAFAVAKAACVGGIGALAAVALAAVLSGAFPIGVARPAEPDPGLRFDATTLLVGGLALALLTTVSALPAALLGARASAGPPPRSPLATAWSGLSPAATQGLRFAALGGRDRSIPLRSTLAAVGLATTATVATVVFGASLAGLIETPQRYGQGWDRMVDAQFGLAPTGRIVERVGRLPEVAGLAGGNYGDVTVGGVAVAGFDLDVLQGEVSVGVVDGEPADDPGEIVLGGQTMDRLGLDVGDTVAVDVGDGPDRMQVTGRGVFPHMGQGSFSTTGLGIGAQLPGGTLPAFADTGAPSDYSHDGSGYNFVAVDAEEGTSRLDAALRDLERTVRADGAFVVVHDDQQPTRIRDLDRVRVVPASMAGVLGIVAVAALAHLLVTSVRERRHELALLRALGFSRRQLGVVVAWQASAIAVLAAIIGVPLGVVLGRAVWTWFERGLHAAAPAETPWGWVTAVGAVLVLASNVVAAGPGVVAGRTAAATGLRKD